LVWQSETGRTETVGSPFKLKHQADFSRNTWLVWCGLRNSQTFQQVRRFGICGLWAAAVNALSSSPDTKGESPMATTLYERLGGAEGTRNSLMMPLMHI
jgi:hypothetical protein